MSTTQINCLFSHKCGEEAHLIGPKFKDLLISFGICLQIDPFEVGDRVEIRMQTFDIEAVVFLCSLASLDSGPCQIELRSAERQGIPIFIAHVDGAVPKHLKKRSSWHIPPIGSTAFVAELAEMADSIQNRVLFNRQLRLLRPGNYFHETIDIARFIATEAERTIVAEFACDLAMRYRRISDSTTRFWMALALGKADTPQAAKLLEKLPKGEHPLELEGIRQAREMLRYHRL